MKDKLPGDYVAGFIDGEGCFYLLYRSETRYERKNKPVYFRWLPYFAMNLREDDIEILKKIKNTLNCGNVYLLNRKEWGRMAYFGIQSIDDLFNKILPFFDKYPLRAKKKHDFDLWRQALKIIYRHKKDREPLSLQDHKKLITIRERMRMFKSKMNRGYKNSPKLVRPIM